MKYAIIKTGGKQYKVSEGDILEVERLAVPQGPVVFDQVLFFVNDGNIQVGKPLLSGVTIAAQVLEHVKGQKIRVGKFKAKARYRKVMGHRQSLSRIKITQVGPKTENAEKVSEVSKRTEKRKTAKRVAK